MFQHMLCPVFFFFFFFFLLARFIVLYPILCIVSDHNIYYIQYQKLTICIINTLLGGLGWGNLGIYQCANLAVDKLVIFVLFIYLLFFFQKTGFLRKQFA